MSESQTRAVAPEGFAARLRELRRQRQWSQKELADRVNLHHTHISRYENGTSRPTADALTRLATALEVPGDYLLGGDSLADRLQSADLLLRFQKVAKLPPEDQTVLVQLMDAFIVRREMEGLLQKSYGRASR